MSVAETKRRGRPAKIQGEDAAIETIEPEDDSPEFVVKPTTPPCPHCGKPVERSTTLLRVYEMNVLRCVGCQQVSIEGDGPYSWYDEATAKAGKPPLIASRAAAIFAAKRANDPLPSFDANGFEAAVSSEWDDPRWTHLPN
jgi:hypothetical protein